MLLDEWLREGDGDAVSLNQRQDEHGPGDFFEIPAGQDAYVAGNERVELVLFAPPDHAR